MQEEGARALWAVRERHNKKLGALGPEIRERDQF
jgi:hypothetical protein